MLTVRQLEGLKCVLHSCFSLILTYKAEAFLDSELMLIIPILFITNKSQWFSLY